MTRLEWVTPGKQLTLSHQCQLVGVSRTTVYARRKPQILREVELLLCRLIDEDIRGDRSTAAEKWCATC